MARRLADRLPASLYVCRDPRRDLGRLALHRVQQRQQRRWKQRKQRKLQRQRRQRVRLSRHQADVHHQATSRADNAPEALPIFSAAPKRARPRSRPCVVPARRVGHVAVSDVEDRPRSARSRRTSRIPVRRLRRRVSRGTCSGGHYVSYVRVEDRWYLCDDAFIIEVSKSVVEQCQAYLVFYALRQNSTQL